MALATTVFYVRSQADASSIPRSISLRSPQQQLSWHRARSLDRTHNLLNDDQFILSTESCNCPNVQHSLEGGWKRAEHVAHDMIADVNSWSVGWCVVSSVRFALASVRVCF